MATAPGTARPLSQIYDLFSDFAPTPPRGQDIRDALATVGLRQPQAIVAGQSPYAAQETDGFIKVDCTGGAVTVKLPPQTQMAKLDIIIKKLDATGNAVTIQPADADAGATVDGGASVQINAQNAASRLWSDGVNWFTW